MRMKTPVKYLLVQCVLLVWSGAVAQYPKGASGIWNAPTIPNDEDVYEGDHIVHRFYSGDSLGIYYYFDDSKEYGIMAYGLSQTQTGEFQMVLGWQGYATMNGEVTLRFKKPQRQVEEIIFIRFVKMSRRTLILEFRVGKYDTISRTRFRRMQSGFVVPKN